MTPDELRRRLARLHPVGPITESLERALNGSGPRTTWYETQQEHLLGWLYDYSGPGYYKRADWDRTAEFVYNHFNCAPGLVWIAEAAGAPRALLLKAKRAVLGAAPYSSARSAAARRVLPWELVERLLNRRSTGRNSVASSVAPRRVLPKPT
jgi:hypothetical protein